MSHRLGTALLASLSVVALAACGSGASTSATTGAGSAASSSASASTQASSAASSAATTTSPTATAAPRPTTQLSYEGMALEVGPPLAPASTTGAAPVDGISCAPVEQLVYHIHAHLAVFANGRLYSLPAGIGIPGSTVVQSNEGPVAAGGHCYYWLHTHTSDGVIHVESPVPRIYTLGDFFDEWRQPLGPARVGRVHGKITAFFDGKLWRRSLRAIPLLPHADIQLNIGEPTPPLMSVDWARTHL